MNLTYLRAFYATIQCNSISKAAIELHLTQPGLSRQLKSLEREVGEVLLDRSNKGVELTDAGKILYESASSMLALEDNIMKNLEELRIKNNKLYFLCCHSIGQSILPCSIYTFKEIYFNIDIQMELENHTKILEDLLTHSVNLAIIQNIELPSNLNTINIISDYLILVSGNMSAPDSISLEELPSYPIILKNKYSGIYKTLNNELSKHSINIDNLNILLLLNSIESIKASVIGNKTLSFLPEASVRHELRRGTLKKITIDNLKMPIDYCMAYRKNYHLTSNEQKLAKFLTSKKRCFCY